MALATATDAETLVFVWNRDAGATSTVLALRDLRGADVTVETVFPTALPAWETAWDPAAGRLRVDFAATGERARVLRVRRA